MNTLQIRKIAQALKATSTSPSKEWQNKMLMQIKELEQEDTPPPKYIFNLFNPLAMKKLLSGVVAVLVVAGVLGYVYTTNTPYAKALSHLEAATEALEQLSGPASVETTSFFPTAYAEDEDVSTMIRLIVKVEAETDDAIAFSDEVTNLQDVMDLLEKIDNVQTKTIEVLSNVIGKTNDSSVIDTAANTVQNTDTSRETIGITLKRLKQESPDRKSIEKRELTQEIKTKRVERRSQKMASAQEVLDTLKTNYDNMTSPMKQKFDAVSEILAKCKTEGVEKCQFGKAQGLATALRVQTRNEQKQIQVKEDVKEIKQLKQENKREVQQLKQEIKENKINENEPQNNIREQERENEEEQENEQEDENEREDD